MPPAKQKLTHCRVCFEEFQIGDVSTPKAERLAKSHWEKHCRKSFVCKLKCLSNQKVIWAKVMAIPRKGRDKKSPRWPCPAKDCDKKYLTQHSLHEHWNRAHLHLDTDMVEGLIPDRGSAETRGLGPQPPKQQPMGKDQSQWIRDMKQWKKARLEEDEDDEDDASDDYDEGDDQDSEEDEDLSNLPAASAPTWSAASTSAPSTNTQAAATDDDDEDSDSEEDEDPSNPPAASAPTWSAASPSAPSTNPQAAANSDPDPSAIFDPTPASTLTSFPAEDQDQGQDQDENQSQIPSVPSVPPVPPPQSQSRSNSQPQSPPSPPSISASSKRSNSPEQTEVVPQPSNVPSIPLQIQLRDLRRQNSILESSLERAEEELFQEKELKNNLKIKSDDLKNQSANLKEEIENQKSKNVELRRENYEEQVSKSTEIATLKEKILRYSFISSSSPGHNRSSSSSDINSDSGSKSFNGDAVDQTFTFPAHSDYSSRERGKFELGKSNDEAEIEGSNGPDLEAYLLKRIQERRALGQGSANTTYTNASSSSSASNPPKPHLPPVAASNPTLNQESKEVSTKDSTKDPKREQSNPTAKLPPIPRLPPISSGSSSTSGPSSPSPPSTTTPRLPSISSAVPLVSSPLKRKLEESDFGPSFESPEKKQAIDSSSFYDLSQEAQLRFQQSLSSSNPFSSDSRLNGA